MTHFIFNFFDRMFWTEDLLISSVAPSFLTIRDRSTIVTASITFTIISLLDIFGQPLLGNEAAEALPAAKNACQRNIVTQARTLFLYSVFMNAYVFVDEYSNKKQNWMQQVHLVSFPTMASQTFKFVSLSSNSFHTNHSPL